MKWASRLVVSRDTILGSRWVSPFAHRLVHPSLWHLNRRSLARGVALGLFAGLLIPVGQIVVAAFLALSVRANVIVAATATLITNPLTFPAIYYAAYRIGLRLLGMSGTRELTGGEVVATAEQATTAAHHSSWALGNVLLPLGLGLLVLAIVTSILGYQLAWVFWMLRVRWRWRCRALKRQSPAERS